MPQKIYESRGGIADFYYYDHYTAKAPMTLQPIEGNDWSTGPERLIGDTWDPKLLALPNWAPLAPT